MASDIAIANQLADKMAAEKTAATPTETPTETPTVEATPVEAAEPQETPQETASAEPQAETTETQPAAEEQPAAQTDTGADDLNAFLDSEDQSSIFSEYQTQNGQEEKKEDPVQVPQEIQQKADYYDQLMSDNRIKAFADFINEGGKIEDFASKLGIVDVSKLSNEKVFEMELKDFDLNKEQIEHELEIFKDKSAYEQKRITDDIRSKYDNRNEEAVKNFSSVTPEQLEAQRQEQERFNHVVQTAQTELDNKTNWMVGKKLYNLEITPDMANQIKQYAANHTTQKVENGKIVAYDIETSVDNAMWALFKKPLLKAVQNAVKTQTMDNALTDRHRPSDNVTTGNTARVESKDNLQEALRSHVQKGQRKLFETKTVPHFVPA